MSDVTARLKPCPDENEVHTDLKLALPRGSFAVNTMGNPRHSSSRQAKGRGGRRHPFLRRLEYVFWFAGAAAGVWFVLASLGIISFQVTQARRLEKMESDVAAGGSLREDFDSAHWAIGHGCGRR